MRKVYYLDRSIHGFLFSLTLFSCESKLEGKVPLRHKGKFPTKEPLWLCYALDMEKLVKLEPLYKLLRLLLWTGQLTDERASSAIIVAPASGGKTSSFEHVQCGQSLLLGDLTARSMKDILSEKHKNVTHLLLGDMLAMFGHKKATVDLTKQIVAKLTGEVLTNDPWSGESIEPRSLGLITAIPDKDFPRYQKEIDKGGFGSRFLIAKFSYGDKTKAEVHDHIMRNGYANGRPEAPFTMNNPGKKKVVLPLPVARKVKELGIDIARDPLGYRAHRQLRALVKASARSKNKGTASNSDFEAVEELRNFFVGDGKQL